MGVIVRSSVSEYVRKRESVRNKLQKLESHTSERTIVPRMVIFLTAFLDLSKDQICFVRIDLSMSLASSTNLD